MKKYLLDSDSFRLNKTHAVTEGGMSRNLTVKNYLVNKLGYKPIEISGNSTLSAIQAIWFFLRCRNVQIFIMYPTRFFLMGGKNIINRILGNIAVKSFLLSAKRNRVIVDVSDIKYEQFKDLEIPCPDLELIEKREQSVFVASAEFVFASSSMKEFAVQKFGVEESRCEICINGGRFLDLYLNFEANSFVNKLSNKHINCVYAGTLNKGRLIDKMLDCFNGLTSARLYLMGPMGEWIEEYLISNNLQNVYYLGAKGEQIAHQIVAQCDIGLIPYDETRLYYNIAYPTKLSFYLTAGIPYLSTPVKEVKMIQDKQLGYIGTISEWKSIIYGLSKDNIMSIKERINVVKKEFTWDSILENCKLINR